MIQIKYPNIEAERARLCLTRKGLCTKIGIAELTYRNWQSGKAAIPLKRLEQLAALFGTSIDYLIGGI